MPLFFCARIATPLVLPLITQKDIKIMRRYVLYTLLAVALVCNADAKPEFPCRKFRI